MKTPSVFISMIMYLISCDSIDNTSRIGFNSNDSLKYSNSIKDSQPASITQKTIIQNTDIPKLSKGFNNIYFGEREDNSNLDSIQQIGDYKYNLVDKEFDERFGLYQFGLESLTGFTITKIDEVLDEIDKIISELYKKQTNINEIDNQPSIFAIMAEVNKKNSTSSPEIPKDWGTVIFIKRYENLSKILKVGYHIYYRTVYGTKEVFYGNGGKGQIEDKENIISFSKEYRIYLQLIDIKALVERNRVKNQAKEKQIAADQSKF